MVIPHCFIYFFIKQSNDKGVTKDNSMGHIQSNAWFLWHLQAMAFHFYTTIHMWISKPLTDTNNTSQLIKQLKGDRGITNSGVEHSSWLAAQSYAF